MGDLAYTMFVSAAMFALSVAASYLIVRMLRLEDMPNPEWWYDDGDATLP